MKFVKDHTIGITIAAIIVAIILVACIFLFGTESGQRALKSFTSDFDGGLERTITVHDYTGNVIKTYEGKFDIDYDNNRILFDDEDGKRHQISGGIVTIDEK